MKRNRVDPSYEKLLPEDEAQKFRKLYTNTKCLCGHDLSKNPIIYYVPHSGGWAIEGETQKVWLYIKCPKCGYDMNLSKLGVSKEVI